MNRKPTYEELEQKVKELENKAIERDRLEEDVEKIFNLSLDMIGSGHLDGYFTKINSSFRSILGYTEEEFLEKPFIFFVHDEDIEKTKQALAQGVKGKQNIHIENRYKCKDDSYKWVEWKVLSIVQENKFIAVGRDITERKQAEEALRESEEKFRVCFSSINDAVFVHPLRKKGFAKFIEVNDVACKRYGYTKEEFLELTPWDITKKKDVQVHGRSEFRKHLLDRGSLIFETIHIDKSRKEFPVEINSNIIELNDQKVILAVVRDITERKQAGEALRKSEERYRLLADNVTDVIWTRDMNLNLTYISPSVKNQQGYTVEEAMNRTLEETLTPGSFKLARNVFAEELEVERGKRKDPSRSRTIAVETKCKDGSTIWSEMKMSFLRDRNANPVGVIGISRDITKRRKAMESLQESEERFRETVELLPSIVCEYDTKGRFTYVNNYGLKTFGYTLSDLEQGLHASQMLLPDEMESFKDRFSLILKGEKPESYEYRLQHKDGSIIYVLANSAPIYKDGKIAGVRSSITPITERKQAEEALKKSESMRHGIFMTAPIGITVVKDRTFIDANSEFCNIVGYNEKELIGTTTRILYESDEEWIRVGSKLYTPLWEQGFASAETHHIRKDGEIRDIVLRAAPVLTDDVSAGVVFTIEDVTNRKLAEEEKKKLEAQLQQAQKMEAIGTLAGGIAHDFNNILSAVIGYTEISLDDVAKGTLLYSNLQEVLIAGHRAKDLVNQILTFARRSDAEVKPTKVSTIAKETLKLIRSTIPASIEIKQNIHSDSLIMANPALVHQIFMNLYTNANHAMEDEGGVLEVNLKDVKLDSTFTGLHKEMKPGDYLKISVSDTGTGISPDIIESIFEPYLTTKEPGEGTGMGLAVVHGIVKGYGGEITVQSKMGKGTVFTVYLPVTKKHIHIKPYPVEEVPLGTERILFVDDELPIVKMNKQALESLGYKVTIRTSSIEALEVFRSMPNDFDLVITDMTMPNMNGDKLAGELMKIRPDIPVIISTGYSKKISDERAAEIGIKAFAMKPISKAELAKTVRKVLDESMV